MEFNGLQVHKFNSNTNFKTQLNRDHTSIGSGFFIIAGPTKIGPVEKQNHDFVKLRYTT